MANDNSNNSNNDLISWLIVVIALVVFWPVGLILLFRKLMGGSTKDHRRQQTRHPYDLKQEYGSRTQAPGTQGVYGTQRTPGGSQDFKNQQRAAPQKESRGGSRTPPAGRGQGLVIGGAITSAVFAVGALSILGDSIAHGDLIYELAGLFPLLGFCGAGLVMLYTGLQRGKRDRRFRKYLALIGKRQDISITTLAQAMPVSIHSACADLQTMLDTGILPTGYLDMSTGRLVLSEEGLRDNPAPTAKAEQMEPDLMEAGDDAILAEIRAVNDAIADAEMSQKIDRVGEITGKIFAYQKQNPGRETQLRSFLSYYLPTTLKILRAYAQMEAQGIDGENIHSAKQRIEGMMNKVVEGFEKQLDKLFQNDAMDITTDVEVLERMLDKDGLSGGPEGFQLGC